MKKNSKVEYLTVLKESKSSRTRFFSYTKQSGAHSKRMMNLLLLKTAQENIRYNMDTFPARHVFKIRWHAILSSLTPEELIAFKEYIHLFWTKDATTNDFIKKSQNIKTMSGVKATEIGP